MIYADNAATTQISDLAFTKMLPFLREEYGNASTQYSLGIKAKRAIEFARKQVADAIGSDPSEIIFTSGGSEGNSWVLQGISILFEGEPIHIVTSSIEHYSVIKSCSALEKRGISVTYLPVNSNGFVSVSDIKSSLRSNTKLVSIMLANNEIGTIQPISEIGKLLRDLGILFHTDAVQAIGHMPINVRDLEVDFMTASAHKFNGAKGTGFLYSRSGLALPPIIFGGNQEQGKRSGTENVAGFVALGYAIEENVAGIEQSSSFVRKLIEITLEDIIKQIPDVYTNGDTF
ncbi:MAG TPA: cysteine desulfurase family protein, partial [Spirochaetales bacterium]|nr:cysteine desulfurase family protein [Spirochaetales bacterium]